MPTLDTCSVGKPSPSVTWLKDKSEINVGQRTEIYNEVDVYFLVIKDCTTKNSGEYTVKAENSFGSTSANFTVNVQGTTFFTL